MTYKIIFNYYKPGHLTPGPDGFAVSLAGHINITFEGEDGSSVTYGMNTDHAADPRNFVLPSDVVDGILGQENYGIPTHKFEMQVSEATYNMLRTDAQNATDTIHNYNFFLKSCITYANDVYRLGGGQGHILDQFMPMLSVDEWGLLVLAREPFAAAAGLLALAVLTLPLTPGFLIGFSPAIAFALVMIVRDPLILDLDGDGIELTALGVAGQSGASNIYFDYDRDGFAERTGWVSADDGMLAFDANGNGVVDGIGELFGSPSQDGYAVLETLDTNRDGVIDANDRDFAKLRVWRDLNQNGVTDAGELQTLAEAGIASISLTRSDVTGTNAGHDRGFQGNFTRTNGTTGTAETIYFQTDRRTTQDNTPGFTTAEGVDQLPQLPGSGQIHSIAYKATNDAAFRADWAALTDNAAVLTPDAFRAQFEALLLRWAGVDTVAQGSRGAFVDAQHLAFVEKFFGDTYREIQFGQQNATSPSQQPLGNSIEGSYQGIVNLLSLAFLAQSVQSQIARGGDIGVALNSPYLFYALLDFRTELAEGEGPSPTPGNLGVVADLIKSSAPENFGEAVSYYTRALNPLVAMTGIAFAGDAQAYANFMMPRFADVADATLREIATGLATGAALLGDARANGIEGTAAADVVIGGTGDDYIETGAGADIIIIGKGEGNDYIRDTSVATGENDVLVLRDILASEVTIGRAKDALIIRVTAAGQAIYVEDFFRAWGIENRGIDSIKFSDGTAWSRADILDRAVHDATPESNYLPDSPQNDILRGGRGHDTIRISEGNDTILYAKGDDSDTIIDATNGLDGDTDKLILQNLNSDDVELNRADTDLIIAVKETGDFIRIQYQLENGPQGIAGEALEYIQFANGVSWDRTTINAMAWVRGGDYADSLGNQSNNNNETILAGKGADHIYLHNGSDTIVYHKGDGNDFLSTDWTEINDLDVLKFVDLSSDEVSFSYEGENLIIAIKPTGERISVEYQFSQAYNLTTDWNAQTTGIDQIIFSDGEVWSRQDIFSQTGVQYIGRDFANFTYSANVGGNWTLLDSYWQDEFGNMGDVHGFVSPVNNNGIHDSISTDHDKILTVYAAPWNDNLTGNNSISGQFLNDILNGGDGNDRIFGHHGDDYINGGNGNDSLDGWYGNDEIHGGTGSDTLSGFDGNDLLYGEDGADSLFGGAGSNEFWGGAGNDSLLLGNGADIVHFSQGDGHDTISQDLNDGLDQLVFDNVEFVSASFRRTGVNLIVEIGGSSADSVFVYSQFYSSDGGIDEFIFSDRTLSRSEVHALAAISGTVGVDVLDTLPGIDAAETYILGKGDDIVRSFRGTDTFIYRFGDGNDIIEEVDTDVNAQDVIRFIDIAAGDVDASRVDDGLLLTVKASGESLFVVDQFYGSGSTYGVENIQFSDGMTWGRSDIYQNAWYRGTNIADRIWNYGYDGDDTVEGGKGNDDISVGNGSDTYIYSLMDGSDVIYDLSNIATQIDTLKFRDMSSVDIRLSIVGHDLQVAFVNSGDIIVVSDHFYSWLPTWLHGLERIEFADGEIWDRDDIAYWSTAGSIYYAGTTGDDSIMGSYLDQRLEGGFGNDAIDSQGGSDLVFGGAGDDILALNISLPGNIDGLDGQAGIDTAVFQGFGSSVLVDLVTNEGEARTRDNASLTTGTWRTIATLRGFENITGTSFNDDLSADAGHNSLVGGDGNDRMDGRSGADTLDGGNGNDVLIGGADNDLLVGGAGSDTLDGSLGIDTVSYAVSNAAVTVIINGTASGGHAAGDTILNIENIIGSAFADKLTGDAQANEITGSAGNDTLNGGDGDDVFLIGTGAGRDAFNGGNGTDEIRATAASAIIGWSAITSVERISGNGFANVTIAGDSNANVIDVSAITLSGIASINAGAGNDTVTGSAGNDTINGGAGADQMSGGLGNDVYVVDSASDIVTEAGSAGIDEVKTTLAAYSLGANVENLTFTGSVAFVGTGNTLDNVLTGGSGADQISGGAGNDTLNGGAGNDRMRGGAGNDTYIVDAAADVVTEFANEGTDEIQTTRTSWTLGAEIENLIFTGTAASTGVGNALANRLKGTSLSDTLTGGQGADQLEGNGGSDIYVYARGDGNDRIVETYSMNDTDRLRFTDLNPADVVFSRSGNDLVGTIISNAETITVADHFYSNVYNLGVEVIQFASGVTWNLARINAAATGSAAAYGTAGIDNLSGTASNDTIFGEDGNDTISGLAGNDVIGGGHGNDTLNGGAGSDYHYGDSGNDLIMLSASAAGDIDRIDGGDGTDTLNLSGFASAVWVDLNYSGNEVSTKDGPTLDSGSWRDVADVIGVENVTGSAFADRLYGNAGVNAMIGGAGNDRIEAREGNDSLDGGLGDDTLIGGLGNDTYTVDSIADFVTEAASEGTDLIRSSATIAALAANVENLTLIGTAAINGTGNGLANTLIGNSGSNALSGGAGADRLDGAGGADTLTGGTDNDYFVFKTGYGKDTVADFVAGTGVADVIEMSLGVNFDTYAEVTAAASQVGADTVIAIDANTSLTLKNVSKTALVADDFVFV